jgi:hypothetical protein
MGYTHYWSRTKALTKEGWETFHGEVEMILEHMNDIGVNICGPDGEGEPRVDPYHISFNGCADNGEDHETFDIRVNGTKWARFGAADDGDFTKTAHKPYDLAVCMCLLSMRRHLGWEVSSDGGFGDWRFAAFEYEDLFHPGKDVMYDTLISIFPEEEDAIKNAFNPVAQAKNGVFSLAFTVVYVGGQPTIGQIRRALAERINDLESDEDDAWYEAVGYDGDDAYETEDPLTPELHTKIRTILH